MQVTSKALLLSLLVLKLSTLNSVGAEQRYNIQAQEEDRVKDILGFSTNMIVPPNTSIHYAGINTHPHWFTITFGDYVWTQEGENTVVTQDSWPHSFTYTNNMTTAETPYEVSTVSGPEDTPIAVTAIEGYAQVTDRQTVLTTASSSSFSLLATDSFGLQRTFRHEGNQIGMPQLAPVEDISKRTLDPESLQYALQVEAEGYIEGKTPAGNVRVGNQDMFSVIDPAGSIYTRNPDFFLGNMDFSGYSVFSGVADGSKSTIRPGVHSSLFRACVLIAPQYALGAAHYGPMDNWGQIPYNPTVRFVSPAGTVYTRTVIGRRVLLRYGEQVSDIAIFKLDSALPADIKPFKLLPPEIKTLLPGIKTSVSSETRPEIPLFVSSAERTMRLCRSRYLGGVLKHSNMQAQLALPVNQQTLFSWYRMIADDHWTEWANWDAQDGDSATPWFLIHNGEPILIGTHYSRESTGGDTCDYLVEIQAAIDAFGGGTSFTTYDFTPYNYATQ